MKFGGAKGDRTPDLIAASDALSQLSYGPKRNFQMYVITHSKI
jgi:hypothetical protein